MKHMQSCIMIYLTNVVTLTSQRDYKILKAFMPPWNSITQCTDLYIILGFQWRCDNDDDDGDDDVDRISVLHYPVDLNEYKATISKAEK